MKTYPLESLSVEEATEKQFKMVECIMRHFEGFELLSRGDLGVRQPANQPLTTVKAEKAIAEFFGSEEAVLLRGSGTGAIRYGLAAIIRAGEKILIHDAFAYSTTATTFEMFSLQCVKADFNDAAAIRKILRENSDVKAALVQVSRQKIDDRYDLEEVITAIKAERDIPIITDDNYAVMKINKIGVECGSDLSAFSAFKLQGPEGIGIIVGKKTYVDKIRKMQYSGGCQCQGWEAMEVLRGLVQVPVLLAIQAQVLEEASARIHQGEVPGIRQAYIANAQSKVLLVEFEKPIAKEVLEHASKMGALPHPVGSESKYELTPLFYRVSGSFLKENPAYAERMIRINPNRSGADTIIKVLRECVAKCL